MSYVYEVLCEYRDYEVDEDEDLTRGVALYKLFYTEKGYLRSTWKKDYVDWLDELCDLNNLPSDSAFRRCFIRDALDNSHDDLDIIKRWWCPEEKEEEVEKEEEKSSDSEKEEAA